MRKAIESINQLMDEVEESLNDPFEGAIETIFVEEPVHSSKYSDNEPIICRHPFAGNNRICGKTYTSLGRFIRHLQKPNVHGLKIGDSQ